MAALSPITAVLHRHTMSCPGVQGLPDPAPWVLLFTSLRSGLRDPQNRAVPNSQPLRSEPSVSRALPCSSIACHSRAPRLEPGRAHKPVTGAHQSWLCGENKRRGREDPRVVTQSLVRAGTSKERTLSLSQHEAPAGLGVGVSLGCFGALWQERPILERT